MNLLCLLVINAKRMNSHFYASIRCFKSAYCGFKTANSR